jgi:hypothetical protein
MLGFETKGLLTGEKTAWCTATRAGWLRSKLGLHLMSAQCSASIRLHIVVGIDPAQDRRPRRGLAAEVSDGRKRAARFVSQGFHEAWL